MPERWRWKHGAWRYRVPRGLEHLWDGLTEFRLGATLKEAHKTWSERMSDDESARIRTCGKLLDWYARTIIPEKAPATQEDNHRSLKKLRPVFEQVPIEGGVQPHHAWQYAQKRGYPTAAKHEIQLLRHAFTESIQRLGIPKTGNPLKGNIRLPGGDAGRDRYVEDWEFVAALSLPPRRKSGYVLMCQAYARIKLLTGLRMTDMLLLRVEDGLTEGIYARPRKTAKTTGASGVYEWTDELREAWAMALAARPVDISPWLFCDRRGECYIKGDRRPAGFESVWKRFIRRCIEDPDCALTRPFAERDIRAKSSTDAGDIERARQLLQQADARTTKRWYRRRAERIRPLR